LAAAAKSALDAGGWGAGASPLVTGRSAWHARLEARLAEFNRAEAALVFSSGFAANSATIAALVGAGDAVFSDERNHASIIDGCRLSRAETLVYRHADAGHLDELLAAHACRGKRLIVTDTVFSMNGDAAPLVEIGEVARRHAAMLMIDEAHATGVFGASGRGFAETLGGCDAVHIHVGTLSKALGCAGGFITGSRRLIDWLYNRARAYVFSTAPPDALCAAACAALDVVRDDPRCELSGASGDANSLALMCTAQDRIGGLSGNPAIMVDAPEGWARGNPLIVCSQLEAGGTGVVPLPNDRVVRSEVEMAIEIAAPSTAFSGGAESPPAGASWDWCG
jgi:7-keto-8-aminopelargonate synthetase-like enzyme